MRFRGVVTFIMLILSLTTIAWAQEDIMPPAMAIDAVTRDIVYLENGAAQGIASAGDNNMIGFGHTERGLAAVMLTDAETLTVVWFDGESANFTVPPLVRMPPILADNMVYFYTLTNDWQMIEGTPYVAATIVALDLSTGETSNVGVSMFGDGCAGAAYNWQQEILWSELVGFGGKRAIERIQTENFDGFIATLGACDDGVVAVDFGASELNDVRILSENVQDWSVAPDGSHVAGSRTVDAIHTDIVVLDVLTGAETILATGEYDRVAWLDDTTLLVGQRIATDAALADRMTDEEAAIYGAQIIESPEMTPVYDVRLVTIDITTREERPLTELFPNAYAFLRAYVLDGVIYAAVIPDGTAYATALLAAQATESITDDEAAKGLLAPIIYAIDSENGTMNPIISGHLRWQPFSN